MRQGDPLSPYLFILTVELLSAAIKFNPNIKGIKINDSEFLISQYADDSTLALGDDVLSLKSALKCIENFGQCSGLRANFTKTQAVWIGGKRGCGDEFLNYNKSIEISSSHLLPKTKKTIYKQIMEPHKGLPAVSLH